MKVSRAKTAYDKAQTNQAKFKLAIAQVERYKFNQENGITTEIPSAEILN
jgi:hypothetical protein